MNKSENKLKAIDEAYNKGFDRGKKVGMQDARMEYGRAMHKLPKWLRKLILWVEDYQAKKEEKK